MFDRLIARLERAGVVSETEYAALRSLRLQTRTIPAREDLDRGDNPDHVHVVTGGLAYRYRIWEDGQRRIVSLLVPGDLCDGHAPMPFVLQCRVAALTQCQVASAPRQAVIALIQEHPGIARALWWLTLVKLSITQAWLANAGRDADRRIAHLMCEMLVRLRAAGLGERNACEWPLTQTDLGEILGLSTVHVCRVLQGLRDEGLIVLARRRLTVPDVARLRAFAGFDPAYIYVGGPETEGEGEPFLRRA